VVFFIYRSTPDAIFVCRPTTGAASSPKSAPAILANVPGTSTAHRQRIEIDGTPFLFQHGYRFGKVTFITRLPLAKSMTVFTPGHLSGPEVEAVVRGDNPWMLE
jgi:hypothetical protein